MNEETQHFTETGDLLEQLLTECVAVIRADSRSPRGSVD